MKVPSTASDEPNDKSDKRGQTGNILGQMEQSVVNTTKWPTRTTLPALFGRRKNKMENQLIFIASIIFKYSRSGLVNTPCTSLPSRNNTLEIESGIVITEDGEVECVRRSILDCDPTPCEIESTLVFQTRPRLK